MQMGDFSLAEFVTESMDMVTTMLNNNRRVNMCNEDLDALRWDCRDSNMQTKVLEELVDRLYITGQGMAN